MAAQMAANSAGLTVEQTVLQMVVHLVENSVASMVYCLVVKSAASRVDSLVRC
jgi:hypothetical protein